MAYPEKTKPVLEESSNQTQHRMEDMLEPS